MHDNNLLRPNAKNLIRGHPEPVIARAPETTEYRRNTDSKKNVILQINEHMFIFKYNQMVFTYSILLRNI